MEIDFNALLASRNPQQTSSFANSPAVKLTSHFLAERAAPTLLPYQEELLTEVKGYAAGLRDLIEEKSIELLETTPQERPRPNTDIKLTLLLLESELERIKYTARAYKRARIQKIDLYSYHYLEIQNEQSLMSKDEWIYCHRKTEIKADFYSSAFLNQFSENLQDLTDRIGRESMVDEPSADKCVCCKLKPTSSSIIVQSGDDQVELVANALYLIRFSAIEPHLNLVDLC